MADWKNEQHIATRITHDDNCCGCLVITESDNSFEVVFTCNECGKEIGRAPIPHN